MIQTRDETYESLLEISNQYFNEDSVYDINKIDQIIDPTNFYKLREHNVEFEWKIFFEVLWIHVCFYVLFGPFAIILFC